MSEEQKASMTEEQEKENKSPEQEAANPEQEAANPEQEGANEEGSKQEKEEGSSEENQDDENGQKKKRSRIKVRGVYHMSPYFWGSLKALVNISIPGFTIRGIRIVQEKDEEEFHVYPPQGWVGREQKSIVKVHNKEFWLQICEEVSKAYVISREKWEKGRKRRRRQKQEEKSQAEEAEKTPTEETSAE